MNQRDFVALATRSIRVNATKMNSLEQLESFSRPDDLLRFQRRPEEEQEASNQASEFRLQLMMPLASKEVIEDCRARAVHRPNYLSTNRTVETQEVLDLEPLFKAWRAACSSWSFDGIQQQRRFILDITLPGTSSEEAQVAWGHSQSNGSHFVVVEEHVSRFVQGLATVMSMRNSGNAVFEVSGVEEHRRVSTAQRSSGYFKGLQVVLQDLSAEIRS